METQPPSKVATLTGRIISILCSLFFLMDAVMKLLRESHSVEGTTQLEWPDASVVWIGVTLLIPAILYIIPRTAIIGAILLTGYLGGAIATMARIGVPFYFPVIIAVLTWGGLYLRDTRLRAMIPIFKDGRF